MRCPDCNKFASFDVDTDPEITSSGIDDDGNITAEIRIVNTCSDCGTELTEANFAIENSEATTAFAAHLEEKAKESLASKGVADPSDDKMESEVDEIRGDHILEMPDDPEVERTEDFKPPGRPARFQKHYYGITATFTISCSCGDFSMDVVCSDEIQGSGMDSLV